MYEWSALKLNDDIMIQLFFFTVYRCLQVIGHVGSEKNIGGAITVCVLADAQTLSQSEPRNGLLDYCATRFALEYYQFFPLFTPMLHSPRLHFLLLSDLVGGIRTHPFNGQWDVGRFILNWVYQDKININLRSTYYTCIVFHCVHFLNSWSQTCSY